MSNHHAMYDEWESHAVSSSFISSAYKVSPYFVVQNPFRILEGIKQSKTSIVKYFLLK